MTLVVTLQSNAAADDKSETKSKTDLIKYETKDSKINSEKAPEIQMIESEENEGDKKTFFPYASSLTFRGGAAANMKKLRQENPDNEIPVFIGFKYMLESKNSKHQEYGFDLVTAKDPLFFLNGGYKYIIDHTDYLRPYYKIGLAMRFDQGDHLETPFDIKSYSIVGSIGLEDFIRDPSSVRVDLDVHFGKEDFLILLALGWSYAF